MCGAMLSDVIFSYAGNQSYTESLTPYLPALQWRQPCTLRIAVISSVKYCKWALLALCRLHIPRYLLDQVMFPYRYFSCCSFRFCACWGDALQNKYECTTDDQVQADAAAYAPARRYSGACTHKVAALLCMKWRTGRHLERVTSNFIPIPFETPEPWASLKILKTGKEDEEEEEEEQQQQQQQQQQREDELRSVSGDMFFFCPSCTIQY